MPPLSAIDHVLIAVADLDRARLAWERLGFTLTPRGRHLQQGTGNYCVMFARDYIELLGVVDAAQGGGGPGEFLGARGGGRPLRRTGHPQGPPVVGRERESQPPKSQPAPISV